MPSSGLRGGRGAGSRGAGGTPGEGLEPAVTRGPAVVVCPSSRRVETSSAGRKGGHDGEGPGREEEESFCSLHLPGKGDGRLPRKAASNPVAMETRLQLPNTPGERRASRPTSASAGMLSGAGSGGGGSVDPPPRRAQSVPVGHTGAEDTLPVKPGAAACPRRVCLGPRRSRVMRAEADTAPDPGRLQSSSHRPTGSGQDRGPHAAWAPRVCQARGRARREYTPTRGTRLCTLLPGSTDVHKEVTRRSGHRTSRSVVIWGRVV